MSKLSTLSLLNLLRQDKSLWQYYMANAKGGFVGNLPPLPYILLEIIYDLGGEEGRQKVRDVVQKSRMTIGSPNQADILENFKVILSLISLKILRKKCHDGNQDAIIF